MLAGTWLLKSENGRLGYVQDVVNYVFKSYSSMTKMYASTRLMMLTMLLKC